MTLQGSCLVVLLTAAALSQIADTAIQDVDASSLLQVSWAGPSFAAPPISPLQFLIVSSPSEKKVVWTTLQNFESSDGRAFALIDSGLDQPKGLAFDHKRGHLYIADSGAQKIFRYTVLADARGKSPVLTTSGVRLTIIEGHPVEWVTIDENGNLFYTAPDTNNINKIPADVLHKIAKGEYAASSLQIISEKTLEAEVKTQKALPPPSPDALPTDAPPVPPQILSIYEAKLNPHVSKPGAIWADGADLYWTNAVDGKTAGTVVKGLVDPKSNSSTLQTKSSGNSTNSTSSTGNSTSLPSSTNSTLREPFPSADLTRVSSGAYGLAKSDKVIFFSRDGTTANTGLVTGLLLSQPDIVIDFVTSIATPRGLVWDKEGTVYVADESMGKVWSFPSGRMMANAPITKTVTMKGAYGLCILNSNDPAFNKNKITVEDDETKAQLGKNKAVAAKNIYLKDKK